MTDIVDRKFSDGLFCTYPKVQKPMGIKVKISKKSCLTVKGTFGLTTFRFFKNLIAPAEKTSYRILSLPGYSHGEGKSCVV